MMKKVVFMLILFLFFANMISASEIINMKINNEAVNVKTPLVKQNEEIMVPIFEVADRLGIQAQLDQNTLLLKQKEPVFEEVAALENVSIKLLARNEHGFLRDFILEIGNKKEEFHDWINVTNPYYRPKLYSIDLTKDGQEEIVVILTKQKGNGMYINEFHVLEKGNADSNAVKEIFHENLQSEVQKNTSFTYTKDHLKIKLKGKEILKVLIPKYELPNNKGVNLSLEHFVLYKIEKQTLKGVLLVEQDYRDYIGSIAATYRYHNGVLVVDDMEFKRH